MGQIYNWQIYKNVWDRYHNNVKQNFVKNYIIIPDKYMN